MKKGTAAVLCLLFPLVLASCGVYQHGVRTGWNPKVYPPNSNPGSVQLFTVSRLDRPYEEIALVVAYGDLDETDKEVLVKLRNTAADFGADAVVDLKFNVVQSSVLQARGIAVKYTEAK